MKTSKIFNDKKHISNLSSFNVFLKSTVRASNKKKYKEKHVVNETNYGHWNGESQMILAK